MVFVTSTTRLVVVAAAASTVGRARVLVSSRQQAAAASAALQSSSVAAPITRQQQQLQRQLQSRIDITFLCVAFIFLLLLPCCLTLTSAQVDDTETDLSTSTGAGGGLAGDTDSGPVLIPPDQFPDDDLLGNSSDGRSGNSTDPAGGVGEGGGGSGGDDEEPLRPVIPSPLELGLWSFRCCDGCQADCGGRFVRRVCVNRTTLQQISAYSCSLLPMLPVSTYLDWALTNCDRQNCPYWQWDGQAFTDVDANLCSNNAAVKWPEVKCVQDVIASADNSSSSSIGGAGVSPAGIRQLSDGTCFPLPRPSPVRVNQSACPAPAASQPLIPIIPFAQATSAAPFAPRQFAAMTAVNDSVILVGGYIKNQPDTAPADVWRSDDDGISWRQITMYTPALIAVQSHTLNAVNGRLFLIGGLVMRTVPSGNVWRSDDMGSNWYVSGYLPSGRAQHASCTHPTNRGIILAGGFSLNRVTNDVYWSADGAHFYVQTYDAAWQPRTYPALTTLRDAIYLVGGWLETGTAASDVWRSYDMVEWTLVTAATPFTPRVGFTLFTSFDNKHINVINGISQSGQTYYVDQWVSNDGVMWIQRRLTNEQAAQMPALSTYSTRSWPTYSYIGVRRDVVTGRLLFNSARLLIIGGERNKLLLNDVWLADINTINGSLPVFNQIDPDNDGTIPPGDNGNGGSNGGNSRTSAASSGDIPIVNDPPRFAVVIICAVVGFGFVLCGAYACVKRKNEQAEEAKQQAQQQRERDALAQVTTDTDGSAERADPSTVVLVVPSDPRDGGSGHQVIAVLSSTSAAGVDSSMIASAAAAAASAVAAVNAASPRRSPALGTASASRPAGATPAVKKVATNAAAARGRQPAVVVHVPAPAASEIEMSSQQSVAALSSSSSSSSAPSAAAVAAGHSLRAPAQQLVRQGSDSSNSASDGSGDGRRQPQPSSRQKQSKRRLPPVVRASSSPSSPAAANVAAAPSVVSATASASAFEPAPAQQCQSDEQAETCPHAVVGVAALPVPPAAASASVGGAGSADAAVAAVGPSSVSVDAAHFAWLQAQVAYLSSVVHAQQQQQQQPPNPAAEGVSQPAPTVYLRSVPQLSGRSADIVALPQPLPYQPAGQQQSLQPAQEDDGSEPGGGDDTAMGDEEEQQQHALAAPPAPMHSADAAPPAAASAADVSSSALPPPQQEQANGVFVPQSLPHVGSAPAVAFAVAPSPAVARRNIRHKSHRKRK